MKIKYTILWCCFGFGIFFCLTPLFFKWEFFIKISAIVLTIGGGILCSSIVALIVEINNDKRNKILYDQNEKEYNNRILEQRNFIFSGINSEIKQLFRYEVYNFSSFICLGSTTTKLKKEDMSIKNIIKKLAKYCENIKEINDVDFPINKIVKINFENRKDLFSCSSSLRHYKRILDSISVITSNKDIYYINKIIDTPEFSIIKDIVYILEDIVRFSISSDRYEVIAYKQTFFESLTNILDIIGIKESEILNIHYKI